MSMPLLQGLCILLCLYRTVQCTARVAVVGSGVSGAFTAARLRAAAVHDIHVFEAGPRDGGRVQEFELGGETYELGASIFWDYNSYVKETAQRLGLTLQAPGDRDAGGKQLCRWWRWWRWWQQHRSGPDPGAAGTGSTLGSRAPGGEEESGFAVWDGNAFVLNMTGDWRSLLQAAVRYGTAALRYRWLVAAAARRFQRVYGMQAGGAAWETPEQLLRSLGLYNATQQTCGGYMRDWLVGSDAWWLWGGAAFADELAGAVNRCNYNQHNEQLNALAGLVSYGPAAYGSVWRIRGGNRQLVSGLLAESGASVTTCARVTRVRRTAEGRYVLEVTSLAGGGAAARGQGADVAEEGTERQAGSLRSCGQEGSTYAAETQEHGPYDAVVVATPLLGSGIRFDLDDAATTTATNDSAADNSTATVQFDRFRTLHTSSASALSSIPTSNAAVRERTGTPAGVTSAQPSHHPSITPEATAATSVSPADLPGADTADPDVPSTQLLQPYQVTVTSYVAASGLRPSYFGVTRVPPVSAVLVSNSADTPFSAISVAGQASPAVSGVNGSTAGKVYKVFSREALTQELLAAVFEEPRLLTSRRWYAYPRFQPPERFPPFQLAPGLVYGNALEVAASAMEVAAVAGTNSALLVLRHLQGRGPGTEGQA